MAKKAICLIFAFSLSINSFAAIVSDNDGSAFITKGEFDAMKNGFADQIDNYNNSIEGKIDGAIAAYLAGIKLTQKTIIENMFTLAKKDNEKNLGFMLWQSPQKPIDKEDVLAGYFVSQSHGGGERTNSSTGNNYGYTQISNVANGSGTYREVEYLGTTQKNSSGVYNDDKKNWTSAYYYANFPFKGEDEKQDLENWTLESIKRKRLHMHLKATFVQFFSSAKSGTVPRRYTGTVTTDYASNNIEQPGSFVHGSQGTNGGTPMTPTCIQVHTWEDYDASTDEKNNLFLEYNIAGEIDDETDGYAVEYEYRDYYNSGDTERFTTAETKNIQIQDIDPTTSITPSWAYGGSRVDYKKNGSIASNSGSGHDITFMWKYYFQKVFKLKWTKLTNAYYDTLFNEAHYKYFGIPIAKLTSTGKVKFQLLLKNSTADSFKYSIMDKKHINGELETQRKESYKGMMVDRVMTTGTLTGKKTHTINIEFDKTVIWDTSEGDYLWLKVEPSEADQLITADIPGSIYVEYKLN